MMEILATVAVFLLCAAGIGIGLFFRRGPLEKRCSSDPDQECSCRGQDCADG